MINVELEGAKEFEKAIRENPEYTKRQANIMMTRISADYRRTIIRDPWRIGGMGGGVPVSPPPGQGNLRDSHRYKVEPTELEIIIRPEVARKYGEYVHEGTWKMEARPWLDYATEKNKSNREKQVDDFLKAIVNNLAN
jgi:hypothetical protein